MKLVKLYTKLSPELKLSNSFKATSLDFYKPLHPLAILAFVTSFFLLIDTSSPCC